MRSEYIFTGGIILKRIVLALSIFVSLLFSTTVSAHSTLESSSPADGETVQEQLTEITMQYNTSIDPMSTFTLTDANGEEVTVETSVNDNVLNGTIGSPLDNGEYTVEWNIIGADGHPITGTYAFTVDLPEAAGDDNDTVTDNEESTVTEPTDPETENAATTDTDNAEEGSSTNFLLIGIIVLAAILIITMFTLGRKNRK